LISREQRWKFTKPSQCVVVPHRVLSFYLHSLYYQLGSLDYIQVYQEMCDAMASVGRCPGLSLGLVRGTPSCNVVETAIRQRRYLGRGMVLHIFGYTQRINQ
jgi:hypothetical protein